MAGGERALERYRRDTTALSSRFVSVGGRMLRGYDQLVARGAGQLEALSPLKVLARGYAIAKDADGHVVAHASSVGIGDDISVVVSDGEIRAQVTGARVDDDVQG